MNRPHQGIKGLKKKPGQKKVVGKGKRQKNCPFEEKMGFRQGPSGLKNFYFNTLLKNGNKITSSSRGIDLGQVLSLAATFYQK